MYKQACAAGGGAGDYETPPHGGGMSVEAVAGRPPTNRPNEIYHIKGLKGE